MRFGPRHRHRQTNLQSERIGLNDFFVSLLAGLLVFGLLVWWEYPGIPPTVWNFCATAAGVRPPESIFPGYYTLLVKLVYRFCGIGGGNLILRLSGHVALALITMMNYAVIREVLQFVIRRRVPSASRRVVTQIAALVGALAFSFSDPVWRAGQFLTDTTLMLGLCSMIAELFFLFMRRGSMRWAVLCMFLLGLLAAETPVGILLMIALVSLNFVIIRKFPSIDSPFFKPALIQVGKWYLTFTFIIAMALGVGIEVFGYIWNGGLAVCGGIGNLPLKCLVSYWGILAHMLDKMSVIMVFGVCIVPFVVALIKFPAAADEERFLPYSIGLAFMVCGLFALVQFAALPALWFWKYFTISSDVLLTGGLFISAITLAFAVCVFGIDTICRDHARLASQIYGSDGDLDTETHAATGYLRVMRGFGLLGLPLLLILVVVPGRMQRSTREMLGIVRDAAIATVNEAENAIYLFSDGNLDALVELQACAQGKTLRCADLYAKSANAKFLRLRGHENNAEDNFSFGFDAAMGLRGWIRERPRLLDEAAVQLGFDLWKRDGKALPPMGGLLSRPNGWKGGPTAQAEGIRVARSLIDRILALYARGGIGDCTWEPLRKVFCDVQWRLSRMCFYRGEALDCAGQPDAAIAEVKLSNRLNELNERFVKLQGIVRHREDEMQKTMTPREGLQLALVRADFTMGKAYSETILQAYPEDPDANFAMGMYYLKERQLYRAREYLKRCLLRRPKEPAVFNNLAMIEIELGRLDAAEVNLNKALALVPQSAAVLDTKRRLEKARKDARAAAEPGDWTKR